MSQILESLALKTLDLIDPFLTVAAEHQQYLKQEEQKLLSKAVVAAPIIFAFIFLNALIFNDTNKSNYESWFFYRTISILIFICFASVGYFVRSSALKSKVALIMLGFTIMGILAYGMTLGYKFRSQWMSYFSAPIFIIALRSPIFSIFGIGIGLLVLKPIWGIYNETRLVMTEFEFTSLFVFGAFFWRKLWIDRSIADILLSNAETLINRHQQELSKLATQVAHDIRSPLAALDVAIHHSNQMPEEIRLIVRMSITRIRDIAQQLLEKNRTSQASLARNKGLRVPNASHPQTYLISNLVEQIISEKYIQLRTNPGIKLGIYPKADCYGLFAKVHADEFMRAFSNIIDNSIEALANEGDINISLSCSSSMIHVTVRDSGLGIPPEIKDKVGHAGFTFGKQRGSGLGLSYARKVCESWGGSLKIESEIKKGTTVTMIIPTAEVPEWFVPKIDLSRMTDLVIVDDDKSVHDAWEGLFSKEINKHKITKHHFSEIYQAKRWLRENEKIVLNTVFLIDYEFLGSSETGLDLIESANIASRAILVTSHFGDRQIIERCSKLGVKLIPKAMVAFVPIYFCKA